MKSREDELMQALGASEQKNFQLKGDIRHLERLLEKYQKMFAGIEEVLQQNEN